MDDKKRFFLVVTPQVYEKLLTKKKNKKTATGRRNISFNEIVCDMLEATK